MQDIKIISSAYAIASEKVENKAFEEVMDTSDEWITTRTGIKSRYFTTIENTSDLAFRAANDAINKANISKEEIDLIIVATMTPDNITPSTACLLQKKLEMNEQHVMAFDLNAACSGFLYALNVACHMLEEKHYALIVGSETLSKILDYEDRNTAILFGDGAGAMIIQKDMTKKQMFHYAQSIGDDTGILEAKGIKMNSLFENSGMTSSYLQMNGKEVFRFAIKAMETAIHEVLTKANVNLKDIDLIIPHQANKRIIANVAKHLNLGEEKFYMNLDQYGNTSAASIPIAFAQACEENKIKENMKIVLVGFGAGFTYASTYIEM